MKQVLITATAFGAMLGLAEAGNDGNDEEQVSTQGSFFSDLTRGAAVSEAIRSIPTDPLEPGERGRTVRDIISDVPPNPTRDVGGPGLGD